MNSVPVSVLALMGNVLVMYQHITCTVVWCHSCRFGIQLAKSDFAR